MFQRNDGRSGDEKSTILVLCASVSGTWSTQKSSVLQLNVRVQASRWLSLGCVRLTSNAMTNRSILCFKKAYWKTWVLWTGNTSQHRSYQGISLIVHRSARLPLGCRVSRESNLPRRRGNGGKRREKIYIIFYQKHLWRRNHNDKPVKVRRIFSRPGSVKSWVPNFKI